MGRGCHPVGVRYGTALSMIAGGAILAYAITWSPDFIDLQLSGEIVMLVGILGLAVSLLLEVLSREPRAKAPRPPAPGAPPREEARTRVMRRR